MAQMSKEELCKKAHPALRHAELVEIARTQSPCGAYKNAVRRWPTRQASATRFLAILRRDHPEAFTRLTNPTEHARLDEPD